MKLPFRWDLLMRYRLIEIIAQWEGRVTARHLCNTFGIGRQQASKYIHEYIEKVSPGSLVYDASEKGFQPSASFKPKLTTGTADEYLHILSRNKDIAHTFSGLDLGFAHSEILQVPVRTLDPHMLRTLVSAAREQQRVDVRYISMTTGIEEERNIVPHTLVCTPLRWHVRAYCEKNRDFRDFVLSRFRGTPEIVGASDINASDDEIWNEQVEILLEPDPRLNEHQKAILEHDYGMDNGCLLIKTRAALAQYTLQAFRIDTKKVPENPLDQQIVVRNLEDLRPYFFPEKMEKASNDS